MKKLKRIAALLLVGVLTLSFLTGCCSGLRSDLGDEIVKETLSIVNEEYKDYMKAPMENDPTLERVLQNMLSKIDENGEIAAADAERIGGYVNGASSIEVESYFVMTWDIFHNGGEHPTDKREAVNAVEMEGSELEMLCRMMAANIQPSRKSELTGVAVTYRVVGEKLYVAYAATAKTKTA